MKIFNPICGSDSIESIEDAAEHAIFAKDAGYFPVLIKHNNKAVVLYREGGGHYGKGGRVAFRKSHDGIVWSDTLGIIGGDTDYRNPCAGVRNDGKIITAIFVLDIYHGENDTADIKNGKFRILIYEVDLNNGFKAKILCDTPTESLCSFYGKMLVEINELMMPFHDLSDAAVFSSIDNGYTWERKFMIAPGYYEPTVLKLKDKYIAALRGGAEDTKYGGVFFTSSKDGKTWKPTEDITGVYSHPADLIQLSCGTILLTYAERHPDSQKILAKLSCDDGVTWTKPVRLSPIFRDHDFGYPSSVELESGKIVTVYYSQPGLDKEYTLKDPERYSGKNCMGHSVVYTIEDLKKALK